MRFSKFDLIDVHRGGRRVARGYFLRMSHGFEPPNSCWIYVSESGNDTGFSIGTSFVRYGHLRPTPPLELLAEAAE